MKRDMFDREIRIGALLVYPVRSGSTTYMQALRVTDVVENGVLGRIEKSSRQQGTGKLVQVFCTERAVIVPEVQKMEGALRRYNAVATNFLDQSDLAYARPASTVAYVALGQCLEQAREAGVPA